MMACVSYGTMWVHKRANYYYTLRSGVIHGGPRKRSSMYLTVTLAGSS